MHDTNGRYPLPPLRSQPHHCGVDPYLSKPLFSTPLGHSDLIGYLTDTNPLPPITGGFDEYGTTDIRID
jgi:hypothetical protein